MAAATQVKSILKQPKHGEEIQQEALKTQIQSAITDIEQDMSKTDFADKENRAPQQQILQQQQEMIKQLQNTLKLTLTLITSHTVGNIV